MLIGVVSSNTIESSVEHEFFGKEKMVRKAENAGNQHLSFSHNIFLSIKEKSHYYTPRKANIFGGMVYWNQPLGVHVFICVLNTNNLVLWTPHTVLLLLYLTLSQANPGF